MLTPEHIEGLRIAAGRLTDPVLEYLLKDIAQRVQEAGSLTSTAAYEMWRAEWLGMGRAKLEKELARLLGISRQNARKLVRQALRYGYDTTLAKVKGHAIPFEANASLQQIINTAVALAGDGLKNITQTRAWMLMDPAGNYVPLPDAYLKCTDFAFQQVITGAADYNSAIRRACAGIAEHGVVVTYPSGVRTSLEAAVRRNIMGGLGLAVEQVTQLNHDELGCDGWEISAHACSAPDHEPIQGKQYSDEEYAKLNNSLVRRIGTLNCGHVASPIILGVNSPQYSPEELEKLRADNEKGVDYNGRHYTGYEATQKQRSIERAIRRQKRRVLMAAPGDKQAAKTRLTLLGQEYRRFSKGVGLRTEEERLHIAGKAPTVTKATAAPVTKPTVQEDTGYVTVGKIRRKNVLEEYRQSATPGVGEISYDKGYDTGIHAEEISAAEWLHNVFGGDIKLLSESKVDGEKMADFLWRGKLWDLKTTTTEKSANSAIRHGLKQIKENPGGILLNYEDREFSMELLQDVIDERMKWTKIPEPVDIMIASNGDVSAVVRYKK